MFRNQREEPLYQECHTWVLKNNESTEEPPTLSAMGQREQLVQKSLEQELGACEEQKARRLACVSATAFPWHYASVLGAP